MQKEIISFVLLFSLIQVSKTKTIFDETNIKNMHLKNRIIRGAVGDYCFLKDNHLTNEALTYYEQLSKNEISIIYTGQQ